MNCILNLKTGSVKNKFQTLIWSIIPLQNEGFNLVTLKKLQIGFKQNKMVDSHISFVFFDLRFNIHVATSFSEIQTPTFLDCPLGFRLQTELDFSPAYARQSLQMVVYCRYGGFCHISLVTFNCFSHLLSFSVAFIIYMYYLCRQTLRGLTNGFL